MTKRERKEKLLVAAQRLFDGKNKYSCSAVGHVFNYLDNTEMAYGDAMGVSSIEGPWTADARFKGYMGEEAALARTLAVLLYREML